MIKKLLISGAVIIDTHTGGRKRCDILIHGERIAKIGSFASLGKQDGTNIIDATGCFIIPGLWDAHVHLTAWPEVEDRLLTLLIAYGVTSVRDMGAPLEDILAIREKAKRNDVIAPRIWFAGPFINSSPPWGGSMSVEVDTAVEAIALVDSLVEAGVHFIKAYEMLLPEVFEALANRAEEHGLKIAGHTISSMTIPQILAISPTYDIQHLGGQCTGMKFECSCHSERLHYERIKLLDSNRDTAHSGYALLEDLEDSVPVLEADQDLKKRDELIKLFVENGTWHTPTLTITTSATDLGFETHYDRVKAFQYLPKTFLEKWRKKLSNAKRHAVRLKWGPYFMETVGLMHAAGVQFLAGTDSPPNPEYVPGLTLHFELAALVKAGVSPLAALQSATLNPAKFFDIEDDFGSIEEGKFADLLILQKDPLKDINNTRNIVSVLSRGKFYDRDGLTAIFNNMSSDNNMDIF